MLIQIILIVLIAIIILRLFAKYKSREVSMRQLSGWLAIWLLASAVIIRPDLTVRLANLVGVGRGSDLVIYLAIIFLFYTVFRLLLRIENMEKNLTKVVRSEALKEHNRHE